jgi:AcrR family transcriptional regulator
MAVVRRRGRPIGSDSAETRNSILKASRQVINERGYQAATFQAIARAAGLSRPTLHYYFASREQIYRALVDQADELLADCIATARRQTSLVDRFSAFVTAIHQADDLDRSQIAFLVSARLESTRNPELRAHAGTGLGDFLTTLVRDAKSRGELSEDVATAPVVELLRAMMWGVGFYAGFVEGGADMCLMANQLHRLFLYGLDGGTHPEKVASSARCDTEGDTPSAVGGQL